MKFAIINIEHKALSITEMQAIDVMYLNLWETA
jgi:hypothetical protein